jgi:tetratricopeptide (TPR) repeat protein
MQSGRPLEAYQLLQYEISFIREQARWRSTLSVVLADNLETLCQALQALGNEPKALEAITEAVAIYSDENKKRTDSYAGHLGRALLEEAGLLARMGRHGEALAAVEPAVQIFRRLAVKDRNACLPSLEAALTRQAAELGHLDRITEARAAAAEAQLISADMLPPARS